ncbi:MAG: NAD kinase [Pseudarcicella sp.]|nr:NAD kinase [Pseudarcicella sp.]
MKIAIHGRNFNEKAKPFIQGMIHELEQLGTEIIFSESYLKELNEMNISHQSSAQYSQKSGFINADLLFSLGGDGTLLEAVTHTGPNQTPILGINTGRLGFLATVSPDKIIESLQEIFAHNYSIEKRTLVGIETMLNEQKVDLFEGINFGLNELGIMKTDTSSMIVVKAYLNGEYLNAYWADGLIISTATGSTGYCMSVGGPLVLPSSDIFVIAPMSPHNLNVRPLVVSDNVTLSFEIESRSHNCLISLDSRSKVVDSKMKITMTKENFKAHLIKMPETNFLDTLRSKLNWGLDVRN